MTCRFRTKTHVSLLERATYLALEFIRLNIGFRQTFDHGERIFPALGRRNVSNSPFGEGRMIKVCQVRADPRYLKASCVQRKYINQPAPGTKFNFRSGADPLPGQWQTFAALHIHSWRMAFIPR